MKALQSDCEALCLVFVFFSFIVLFLCLRSLSFLHDNLLFMSSVLFPLL